VVKKSYATGAVTATGVSSIAGGLVGVVDAPGVIQDSYALGAVSGEIAGGLIAYHLGTVERSYSTGAVSGSTVGGLIALAFGGSVNADCYWDQQTSGLMNSAGGLARPTSSMQSQVTYTNWDFANTWAISAGSYPTLR
jgi:hypothetical protein